MSKKQQKRMIFGKALMLLTFLTLLCAIPTYVHANNNSYYVDSENGSDSNDGSSETTPWRTLERVNNGPSNTGDNYQPGDRILFKKGGRFTGQLRPLGSGTSDNAIEISSYGTGDKPLIDGNGVTANGGGAVTLINQSYWKIKGFEIKNYASDKAIRRGILIGANSDSVVRGIVIKDNYIHHVNGSDSGELIFHTGGIMVNGEDTSIFHDILIDNNTIEDVDFTCISVFNSASEGASSQYNTGVVISNNVMRRGGAFGASIALCEGTIFEYNVMEKMGVTPNAKKISCGVWPWSSDNTILRYNECYDTLFNGYDGMSFDIDGYTDNTIYEYNYSHNNGGGFGMYFSSFFESYVKGGVFRYNISQGDNLHRLFVWFRHSTIPMENNSVYNNVFYIPEDQNGGFIWEGEGFRSVDTTFKNNIFYNRGGLNYRMTPKGVVFDNNLFYGNHPASEPEDNNKMTLDPKFVNPGSGGIGMDSVGGYKLQPTSPCINAGAVIPNNGGKDYWGNPLSDGMPDIGAHEYELPVTQYVPSDVIVDDKDREMEYTGTWNQSWGHGLAWLSTLSATETLNDYAELTFEGQSVQLWGRKSHWSGKADIYIDGVFMQTVDTYKSTLYDRQLIYENTSLSAGQHILKMVCKREKQTASTGYWIHVDSIVVGNPPPISTPYTEVDDRNSAMNYGTPWNLFNDITYVSHTGAYTNTAGNYVEFTFDGTSVRWISLRNANLGIANIYIDGILADTVDCYAAQRDPIGVMYYKDGLSDGTHTIKVEVSGQKNNYSGDTFLVHDAFQYR